jgi:hypothetical protein
MIGLTETIVLANAFRSSRAKGWREAEDGEKLGGENMKNPGPRVHVRICSAQRSGGRPAATAVAVAG